MLLEIIRDHCDLRKVIGMLQVEALSDHSRPSLKHG